VSPAEALAEEVRAEVRTRGVDPQREPVAVRLLAEEATRRHERRSLTGAVAPLADEEGALGEIVARVSGLGVLQPLIDDPEVEEIWVNDPSRVFVARRGRHELTPLVLTRDDVRELVERMLKTSGRRLDLSQPFVDAMLPGGHRLHVVLDGISRDFTAVNIRK
jgi:pilus assembly protein CpaF